MAVINLKTFAGMVPALDKRLLSDQQAQKAVNTFLYSGALRGIAVAVQLNDELFDPETNCVFRIPINASDPSYLYDSYWWEFPHIETDVISAPTAGDQYERYYYTSPSEPFPKYNTKARILAEDPAFLLGLPQPGNLSVSVSGGASTELVTRAYISTLVTEYGEEGPASKPLLVEEEKEDATFAVTVAAVDPDDMGVDRNVKFIRLYRTVVTPNATANYYLVHEFDADDIPQTFNDTINDLQLADNPQLESTSWTQPPHLDGFTAMPNGIVIGWVGKELWFSEPYRPHAWPAAYSLTLAFEVIGIAVIGQTAVIATKGNPYTASGVNSFAVTTSMLASFEPCLSKGSIVPTEEGVYYMSPNGLILVNAGRAENITKQFITRLFWNTVTSGSKVNAARFGSAYYAFSGVTPEVFQEDTFQTETNTPVNGAFQDQKSEGDARGFLIDPTNVAMGFILLSNDRAVKNLSNDYYSSEMILLSQRRAWYLDRNPGFKSKQYLWRSKVFQAPLLKNFVAMKVYFDTDFPENDIVPTAPQVFSSINSKTGDYVPLVYDDETQWAIVRVFADGVEIYSAELRQTGQLFNLPSGFKAEYWEIEIEGRAQVSNVQMATSIKELSNA